MPAGISLCFEDARLEGRGGSACEMAGSDVTVFSDFVASTGFATTVSDLADGRVGAVARGGEKASIVRVLRNAFGLGEIGPGEEFELSDCVGCHLSRTDDVLGRGFSDAGDAPNSPAFASS